METTPPSSMNRAQQWATYALACPISVSIVGCLRGVVSGPAAQRQPEDVRLIAIGFFALSCVLILAGLVTGVGALAMMGRHGRKGVLGRSLAGLALTLLSVSALALGMLAAGATRVSKAAYEAIAAVNKDHDAKMMALRAQAKHSKADFEAEESKHRESAATLEKTADSMRGFDRIVVGMKADMYAQHADHSARTNRVMLDFMNAGGLDSTTMPTKKAVRDRIVAVDKMIEASKAWQEAMESRQGLRDAAVKKRGATPSQADEAVKLLGGGLDKTAKSLVTDLAIINASRDILEFLDQRWGDWRTDGNGDMVFKSEADERRYGVLVDNLQKLAGP